MIVVIFNVDGGNDNCSKDKVLDSSLTNLDNNAYLGLHSHSISSNCQTTMNWGRREYVKAQEHYPGMDQQMKSWSLELLTTNSR